jgi:hypothetical protein
MLMLRRVLVVFAVSVVVLSMVGGASASASVSHPFLSSFDGGATPAGSLVEAGAVGVDGAAGDVYVSDRGHKVIDKFSAAGGYLCQITGSVVPSASECNGLAGSATPSGEIVAPIAVAVDNSGDPADPSLGDVYVADRGSAGNGVVDKFSAGGAYLGQVAEGFLLAGVTVDAAGNVWISGGAFGERYTKEFDSSGIPVFQFSQGGITGLAVDSNDFTYLLVGSGLEKFSPSGVDLGPIDPAVFEVEAVAVDLATDEVYSDDSSYIAEYSSQGIAVVQFGSGQLVSGGGGGIGVNPVTGDVYVANAVDGKVYVFAPTPGPRVAPKAATTVQTTGATLNATVNPEGGDTTYKFEYGTTTAYGQTEPVSAVDVGSGGAPVPVAVAVGGLQAGTTYHYRVVASNANGTVSGADRSFTTLPVPAIHGVSATNLTAGSADLSASIDPEGLDTTYRFEYGTSTAYGASVPVPDADIGAGVSDVAVSQHITGLSANTTYHWRVVARNANGIATGSDHTFIYSTTGPGLPDHRAYEMVTPPQKNGALIGATLEGLSADVSEGGSRVIAASTQCLAGTPSCIAHRLSTGQWYLFTRTAGGWGVAPMAPPAAGLGSNTRWLASADASTALFSIATPPGGQDDWWAQGPGGSFLDVGPTVPVGTEGTQEVVVAATGDLSHIVWESEFPSWPFDSAGGASPHSLYEYVGGGHTAPVLVGVSGGVGSTALICPSGASFAGSTRIAAGTLSADGRTVFFSTCTPEGAPGVYARIDQSRTVLLSGRSSSECTGVCASSQAHGAKFVGASADGSRAFFLSTQQLTNSASEDSRSGDDATMGRGCSGTVGVNGCNLYMYDFAGGVEHGPVAVSAGDLSGGGPRVQGVVAVSPDGSRVYFVARGVLSAAADGEGRVARDGAENLYVYERDAGHPGGRVVFVASLPESDEQLWSETGLLANVTVDGRFLVFTSHGALTPDDASTTGALQVFRYDAVAGVLVRISIGDLGFNDNGNRPSAALCESTGCAEDASIVPPELHRAGAARLSPTMSSDGSYVFFESPVGLTPGALDDAPLGVFEGVQKYAQNVYEYHDGRVYLISDGRDLEGHHGVSAVLLLGSDATGANVFFMTADRLVAQDTDTQIDIYDARVCTAGDPCVSAASPVVACQAEACHGAPVAPPGAPGTATATFSGAGNLAAPPPVKRLAKKRAARCAKGHKPAHGRCAKTKRKKSRAKRAKSTQRVKSVYGGVK